MVTADPRVAPALDELKIEFSEPISQRAVSEIFPTQVAPGAATEFSLFFRPKDTKITGFDRLYLEAPTSVRFGSALLNDIPVAVEDAVNESGFEVTSPNYSVTTISSNCGLLHIFFNNLHPLTSSSKTRAMGRLVVSGSTPATLPIRS